MFASAELAVLSVNESKINRLAERGSKKARRLRKLLKEPAKFLSTIQIAITLSGFLGSAFAPDENITREQAAVIIYKYAKLKNIVPESELTIQLDYADSEHISDYACEAVAYCTIAEIMQGCETTDLLRKQV